MECRTLEITLIFAKDLEDVNVDSKMDVDAVVIINREPQTKQKIPVDKDCGSSPKWNYTITFTAEEAAANQKPLDLVICLVSDRLFGDIVGGKVLVPINGFLDLEEKHSFYVRLPKGKVKGTLNLCCKIGEKFAVAAPPHETEKAKSAVYPAVGWSAGYSPQLPAACPCNPPPQVAYQQPPPHFAYQQPPPHFAYQQPPPQFAYQQPPPQVAYQQPPPQFAYQQPPPQLAYQQPQPQLGYQQPPPQVPYQQPPPQVPYQQPPPYWYGASPPPPAQGYEYTGHLPYGGHGHMPAQQPAAGLGQVPAGGLLSSLFLVNMGCDAFASLTDALGGLLNF